MKKSTSILRYAIMLFLISGIFNSCVEKEYDDIVTANVDPNLTPTHTIKELHAIALAVSEGTMVEITEDIIVAGYVVGDDKTGNIYKKIILQEDSAGIAIHLDVSDFYTDYPVGRHVYVMCKGLFIINNDGNIELGIDSDTPGRIPAGLKNKYLVKGKWGQYITPKVYTIDNPNIPTNTLVTFNNVEFKCGNNGVAYAAVSPANLDIVDCDGNTLILYSSTFSTFALEKTPNLRGSITGVYIIYNGEGELQIRDLSDVNMTELRCDSSNGVANVVSVASIRQLYTGAGSVTLPCNLKIHATVISDYSTNMLGTNSRNMYVQDDTTGIQLRFDATPTYPVGTRLEVNISGGELSTFNDVLQINYIPLGGVTVLGNQPATPRITTIAEIIANYDTRESTLLNIPGVTITGTGTYNGASGSNTLTDATGSIVLYTGSAATFKNVAYPTGTVSITGILTRFNATYEILIRDTTDVQ